MQALRFLALIGIVVADLVGQPPADALVPVVYDARDLFRWKSEANLDSPPSMTEIVKVLRLATGLPQQRSVSFKSGQMIVVATSTEHAGVRRYFEQMRDHAEDEYAIRFDYILVPADFAPPDSESAVKAGSVTALALNAEQARALRKSEHFQSGPTVTTQPFGTSDARQGSTRRFVRRYERVEAVEGHPEGLLVPSIDTVELGVKYLLGFVPLLREGDPVLLDADLTVTSFQDPPIRKDTPHGPTYDYTVRTQAIRTTISLSVGASFAVYGLDPCPALGASPPGTSLVILATRVK